MKKIAVILCFFFIFVVNVNALTLNPSSGNMGRGTTSTINIYANPGTVSDVIATMRLAFNNATILSFTKGTSFDTALGVCAGGATDNGTNLCIDVAKLSGTITNNELIGTMSVRWGNTDGTATIVKQTGNGYYNGTVFTSNVGTAGTYTVGEIPRTPLEININSEIIVAFSGLTIMFAGIYLFQFLSNEKRTKKEENIY